MRDELVQIRVDDAELKRALAELGARAQDGTPPLGWFYAHWKTQVVQAWMRVTAAGGTFRGRRWAGMKPQYVRADGTPIPAWGGVPKVRGRGLVKGKMRPSKQRVKQTSILVQDTKELLGDVLTQRPVILDKRVLRIGGVLSDHAEAQFVHNERNPLFFTPDDERKFMAFVKRYWAELARKFNR